MCRGSLIDATLDLVEVMSLPRGPWGVAADLRPVLKTCFVVFLQNGEEPKQCFFLSFSRIWKETLLHFKLIWHCNISRLVRKVYCLFETNSFYHINTNDSVH